MQSDSNLFLGERISNARMVKGFSQKQLAALVGVNKSSIENWETDRIGPRANRLNQLAGILGVPVAWLLSGEESSSEIDLPLQDETMMLRNKLDAAESMLKQLGDIIKDIRQQSNIIQRDFDEESI